MLIPVVVQVLCNLELTLDTSYFPARKIREGYKSP